MQIHFHGDLDFYGSALSQFKHPDIYVAFGAFVKIEIKSLCMEIKGSERLKELIEPEINKTLKGRHFPELSNEEVSTIRSAIISIWLSQIALEPDIFEQWVNELKRDSYKAGDSDAKSKIREALGIREL